MTESDGRGRRGALIALLAGLVVGGGGGFAAGYQGGTERALARVEPPKAAPQPPPQMSGAPPPALGDPGDPLPPPNAARPTFAQQGEDVVMAQMLQQAGITKPTYLDIGAHDPIFSNNTYLLYLFGGKGVLVEPNPAFGDRIKQTRPRDVLLDVGVGVTDQTEADYYVMGGDGQLNTFSKAQVESLEKVHHRKLVSVMKRRLVKINEIMEQHFKDRAPDVLSTDVEGLDYEILSTLDWKRWRPRIVCVETAEIETGEVDEKIVALMAKNGYAVRGGSFVNTVFLDTQAPVLGARTPPSAMPKPLASGTASSAAAAPRASASAR